MRLDAAAYHLGGHVSIVSALDLIEFTVSKTEAEFALFEVTQHSWVYVKDYGSLVFINIEEDVQTKILSSFLDNQAEIGNLPSEQFTIEVDPKNSIKASYGLVQVPEISLDVAHIIALHMAQSVALDDFQFQVGSLLNLTNELSLELDEKGRLQTSRKKIRKVIGSSMVLKNRIAENLYIFESPNLAWEDEKLMRLDEQMRKDLEISKRHQGLQFHLGIIKENLDLYQNILQHKHSSILEWIIILLIFFEILQVIFN